MNLFIYSSKNYLSECGMKYFSEKYGFPAGFLADNFTLVEPPDKEDFCCEKKIAGYFTFRNSKLPLFCSPVKMGFSGDKGSLFFNGDNSYPLINKNDEGYIVGVDLFEHIGFCLSGSLENMPDTERGELKSILKVPFIDYYSEILFDVLKKKINSSGNPLIHISLWPDGKKYAVCLTHDVDEVKKTYQWITHPLKYIRSGNYKGLKNQFNSFREKIRNIEPYWTFDYIIDTEDELNVRSSFYFLREEACSYLFNRKSWRHMGRKYDWNDEKVSCLIRYLHKKGWETGLHGSFYSFSDFKKMNDEKNSLEMVVGDTVSGIRQHNLNLKIPETWIIQEKAGFIYDTTLGYNSDVGFRWGTCIPFRPYLDKEKRELKILEIPLIIEDLPFFRRAYPWTDFLDIEKKAGDAKGVLTLLWHHSVLNETEHPDWAESYKKIISFCMERNAFITNGIEICKWWNTRKENEFRYEYSFPVLKIILSDPLKSSFLTIYLPNNITVTDIDNAVILKSDGNVLDIKSNVSEINGFIEMKMERD